MTNRSAILAMMALLACGKGKSDVENDPEVKFVVDDARDSLVELKAAMKSSDPEKAMFKCAQMANFATLEKGDPALAKDYKQVCTHDFQIAMLKHAVEAVEAAHKAKPGDQFPSECISAAYKLASDDFKTYKTADAESADLEKRWLALCPN